MKTHIINIIKGLIKKGSRSLITINIFINSNNANCNSSMNMRDLNGIEE